jgi:uncharacterized cupin superfamily protein
MKKRPPFIRNWREIEPQEQVRPPMMDEAFAFSTALGAACDLAQLQLLHGRLPPGVRSNPPVASRDEEEFLFILAGTPDLWLDGYLYRLKEGDGVSMAHGTGSARALLNNSNKEVRFIFLSEGSRYASKFFHPAALDAKANEFLANIGKSWTDAPKKKLGPHDGLTDKRRGKASPKASRKNGRPAIVLHWKDILERDENNTYPGSKEQHAIAARFGRKARLSQIGIHLDVLKPGRRTSWPHAERDEEEFVYVVSGKVDVWIDGHIFPAGEGDLIGFPSRTAITHTIINNGDEDAILLVGAEAPKARNQYFYPLHPNQNEAVGASHWRDHPKVDLGPHDGMPDALRAKVKGAKKQAEKASKKTRK